MTMHHDLLEQEGRLRNQLEALAGCAAGAEAAAGRFRYYQTPAFPNWLASMSARRSEYRACLAAIATVRSEAQAKVDRIADELTALRQRPAPLPGSAEFAQLSGRVHGLETERRDAQTVLDELARPQITTKGAADFLRLVDAGAGHAAAFLLRRYLEWATAELAPMVREAGAAARVVLDRVGGLGQVVADATQFAGAELVSPSIVLPDRGAWEKVGEGAAPFLRADDAKKAPPRG